MHLVAYGMQAVQAAHRIIENAIDGKALLQLDDDDSKLVSKAVETVGLGQKQNAILFLVTNSARYIDGLLRALQSLPPTFSSIQNDIILFHADLNASVLGAFRAVQPDVLHFNVQHLFRKDPSLEHPSIQKHAVLPRGEDKEPWEAANPSATHFAGRSCPQRSGEFWAWPLGVYVRACGCAARVLLCAYMHASKPVCRPCIHYACTHACVHACFHEFMKGRMQITSTR